MSDTATSNGSPDRRGKGGQAYNAAMRLLRARHEEEFTLLHRSERLAVGLNAESTGKNYVTTEHAIRQLEKAEAREAKYREILAARGVELPRGNK